MLETIAIPILMKAVEFLFGEGSKILEERRERRKTELKAKEGKPETTNTSSTTIASTASNVIQSKEAALRQPVSEIAWSASEARIKHLMSMLDIHTKNYYLAKEQYAKWGSALVPLIITHQLTEAENGVAETAQELQAILSKVYNTQVAISGLEEE